MHQDGNSGLRAYLPAAQRDTSSVHAKANAWIGEPPSSHLSTDEWWSIAHSLDLSVRQLQIVQCVFDGFGEPSTGQELDLSSHTVHAHLNRIYKKTHVKNRCELIVRVFLAFLSQASAGKIQTRSVAQQAAFPPASRPTGNGDEELAAAAM